MKNGGTWLRASQPGWLLSLLAIFILAACNGREYGPSIPGDQGTVFNPPTAPAIPATATATHPPATALSAVEELRPTATQTCQDNLSYLEDLTIPDGKQVSPGERLDKRWKVKNSGSCNWDARYRLRLVAGPGLGSKESQALYPARSGTEFELRILFTAPDQPGTYRSAWQAYDPRGQPFGDPVFVEISVAAK